MDIFIPLVCILTYFRPALLCPKPAAAPFGFVTAVHKDIQERLPLYNRSLYLQVKEVLDENKAERHIRGGIATRRKYRGGI